MKNSILRLTLLFSFMLPAYAWAQSQTTQAIEQKHDYKNAIGIRAGSTSGLTFKHFMNPDNAFELILGIWPNALGLTGLYEKHAGTGIAGLKFYYGGGAHFTAETGRYYFRNQRTRDRIYVYRYGNNGLGLGIDGVAGLDYKIPVIPLSLSLDIKPYVEVSNYGEVYVALDAGLGIKVAF
jgi:hypothetical protein